MDLNKIGKFIAKLRLENDLTQEGLAEKNLKVPPKILAKENRVRPGNLLILSSFRPALTLYNLPPLFRKPFSSNYR